MGQAILYCFRCSTQLREAQFEQRKAYRIDSWVCCAACAPEAVKSLPPDRAMSLLKAMVPEEKKAQAAAAPAVPRRESTPRIPAASGGAPSAGNKWVLIAAGGAVVLGILLLVVFSGKPAPPPPPEPPVTAPPRHGAPVGMGSPNQPPPPPPLPPSESPERLALLKARKYAQEHPEDLEGQLREYSDLTLLADKTDLGAEARKAVDLLTSRQRVAVDRGMADVEAEIAEPLRRGDYGSVFKMLEGAATKVPGAQWKLALEKRERAVRDEVFKVFDGVKQQYRDARTKGDAAMASTLVARVRSWGLDKLSAELARITPENAPPPSEPSRSPEGRTWDAQREKAFARAAGRDFAGAAAELERAGAALKEEALKKEFADDLRDLKELDRLVPMAIAALASSRTLTVRTVDGESTSGRVVMIDADRVEILADPLKPTVFLEWTDARLASYLKDQNADARVMELYDRIDALPRAKPAPEELQARELYYDAERQFRTMATREKAIDGYRQLKQKFKETTLVKRASARIDRRSDSGKEYYLLPADLSFGGTFALSKDGRLETVAASEPSQSNRNFVEAEFLPLPSATYRCWALVGGCCVDAFTFSYQATGLTELSPKTKKRGPAEPGSDLASLVKHSIRNLKPHARNDPQKPIRWEWVEIPIPKSTAPGTRKLRLLTDQQGFGVASMVVSSSRTKAPTEAETAELAKVRALDAPPAWILTKAGAAPRLLLDDFSQGVSKSWGFHPGSEFPGAKGSQTHDPAVGRDGKGSLKVSADFSGGGAYVSTALNLPSGTDAREVRFWLKTDGTTGIGIRVGDSSDQCHQTHLKLAPTKEWQEVVLTFEKLVGGEHWGGAKDGKLHGPVKWFAICVGKGTFGGATSGELWIDDVEAVLNTDDR